LSVDALINRLDKVKQTGPGKWIARCPAHEDRSPSLAIKDEDGTVLVHCFAGCEVADICDSVGVDIGELFPPKPLEAEWDAPQKPAHFGRAPFTALDAMRCLAGEGQVIAVAAADLADGKVLGDTDRARVDLALVRIATAMEYIDGN
jgi:hypothetical protein